MTAHFYSKAHPGATPVEWWSFSTEIKGVLTLRYPKGAEGQSVALSGQFEGGATRFTYKEDVFNSEIYGKMVKGGKVYLVDVPPAAVDNASGGMVNDMVSPTSFFVPVTGQMTDGKITVVLGEARSDFNDSYTHAHTVYVVIAPTTLMLPVAGHFSLPYMNAHFILDHIGKGDFVVQRAGESMVMQRQQNKDLPGPGNDAVYTIDLKACNPACGDESSRLIPSRTGEPMTNRCLMALGVLSIAVAACAQGDSQAAAAGGRAAALKPPSGMPAIATSSTAANVTGILNAPITETKTLPGDPQSCKFGTAGFTSITVTVRPGAGNTTVDTWLAGRMPLTAVPLAGVGERAAWVTDLTEVVATKANLLCDIQVQAGGGSKPGLQAAAGALCNKVFAAA